jgi:hypothetical protein
MDNHGKESLSRRQMVGGGTLAYAREGRRRDRFRQLTSPTSVRSST